MQKIYEHPKTRYAWNFSNLGISYFEIPKTGSSSTKTVLFRLNYGLAAEQELNIGGGQLSRNFPDSIVKNFDSKSLLNKILIIYRDPVSRAKSAYRSIFLGRQKMQGSLSEYFENYFPTYISSPPEDGLLNHHKPMSWFFPNYLLDDPRSIFVKTENLNSIPALLELRMEHIPTRESKMPHLLNVNKKIGEIDMTDAEVKVALGPSFDSDFEMYEKLRKTE